MDFTLEKMRLAEEILEAEEKIRQVQEEMSETLYQAQQELVKLFHRQDVLMEFHSLYPCAFKSSPVQAVA